MQDVGRSWESRCEPDGESVKSKGWGGGGKLLYHGAALIALGCSSSSLCKLLSVPLSADGSHVACGFVPVSEINGKNKPNLHFQFILSFVVLEYFSVFLSPPS